MALTLAQAKQKLFQYVSATLDPSLTTERINSALERIYNSGKWKGLMIPVSFNNFTDPAQWWVTESVPSVTLPRQYQSILGVQFAATGMPGIPRQVYPQWQEYIAGGAGQISPGMSMQLLVDQGDGFVTYADPQDVFYPRFEITDPADDGIIVTIQIVDAGNIIIPDASGNAFHSIVLSVGGATLPFVAGRIVEIHKPVTEGIINLYAVNQTNQNLKAQIGRYESTETVPSYKRYKIGGSEFVSQLNCLCKRRFVSLIDGNDDETLVVPSNEGALKLTLMALQYEDKNDMERAEVYFNKAIQLLNAELKEDMGDPVITLQMNPVGAALRIPARY